MKIYVAASYPRKEDAKLVAEELKRAGHILIAARWLYEDEGYDSDLNRDETEEQKCERLAGAAVRDIEDVKECDVLVCLTDGENQLTHGGRHSEFGMALLLGKKAILVGPLEQVFHYHPAVIHYDTVEKMLEAMWESTSDPYGA
jgi:hypothetical protein